MQRLIETQWTDHRFSLVLVTHDIEEALALADRVLVMDGGRGKLERPVPRPRPRDRTSREFNLLRAQLTEAILQPDTAA